MTSEHISRSLSCTSGGPRAFGATLRCPEFVLAQFGYDLVRPWAPVRGIWGHRASPCCDLGDPLGSLGGPMAVPEGTFVLMSFGNTTFFISVIDVPSGDPQTALDASAALLGRHLVSLNVPVGEPWTSWNDLGTLWGALGSRWNALL